MDVVARAKGLILDPRAEWARIAPEGGAPMDHFRAYAVPMAAIPALAGLIGGAVFGGVRGILVAAVVAALSYGLSLASVLITAKIVEAVAPSFGGDSDPLAAMKLAVYSPTASWLAGVFAILPFLSFLAILGLYSIYIYWVGVPVVTRVPGERRLVFTVVLVIAAIVINLIIGAIIGLVVGTLLGGLIMR